MILIPEIETVVILVPRTGSTSLKNVIANTYPKSILLYRHMEADGIPQGYDRWRKVGVVRNPIDRLWSLYKFLTDFNGNYNLAYIAAMRESVRVPFDRWITNNKVVFTSPYASDGSPDFYPRYAVRHLLPENLKSQFLYLRPDLGTDVIRYGDKSRLERSLKINIDRFDRVTSRSTPIPTLSQDAYDHVCRVFQWDFDATEVLDDM
jgi:hypothetical protein